MTDFLLWCTKEQINWMIFEKKNLYFPKYFFVFHRRKAFAGLEWRDFWANNLF